MSGPCLRSALDKSSGRLEATPPSGVLRGMRSCKKRVYVYCHHPIALGPEHKCGWADVWLRFYKRRVPMRLAPTLVSRVDLLSKIRITKSIISDGENGIGWDCDFARAMDLDAPPDPEEYRPRLVEEEALLARLDMEGFVVDHEPLPGKNPGRLFSLSNVYTKEEWLDRAEAIRMMDFYLAKINIRGVTYKWNRPEFVAMPVTVGSSEEAEEGGESEEDCEDDNGQAE